MAQKPALFWRNIWRTAGATITPPGSVSGQPWSQVYDHKSYNPWKSSVVTSPLVADLDLGGSPQDADSLLLVNHNLGTLGATIEIKSGAAFPPANVRLAAVTPTEAGESQVTLKLFTAPGTQRYWRVTIAHAAPPFAAAPFIGELLLGLKTLSPEFLPADFDPYFVETEGEGDRGIGGHFLGEVRLGRIHRAGFTFGDAGASRAEWTANLSPWLDHAIKRLPYGFAVDTDDAEFASARWVKLRSEPHLRRFGVARSWARMNLSTQFEEAMRSPL